MPLPLVCQGCGRAGPVRLARFRQLIGLLVAIIGQTRQGLYCRTCESRLYCKTTLVNLTVGLCSFISPFAIPMTLAQNWTSHRRFARQMAKLESASETAESRSVRLLPWEPTIGTEPLNMNGVQITWPIAAIGLTMITLAVGLIGLVMAAVWVVNGPFDRGVAADPLTPMEVARDTHEARVTLGITAAVVAVSLAGFAGGVRWQLAREERSDGAPDVLAQLLPASALFQVGRLHFGVLGRQLGPRYRLIVCAQNLFDMPTGIHAGFLGLGDVPILASELPPAGVVVAFADCPLPGLGQSAHLRVTVRLSTRGTGGRRVRRANRPVLSSKSRDDAFALAQALAGGGGSIQLSRPGPTTGIHFLNGQGLMVASLLPAGLDSNGGATRWHAVTVWDLTSPPSVGPPADTLAAVLGGANSWPEPVGNAL